MSYQVVVTFDLVDEDDYGPVTNELANMGLGTYTHSNTLDSDPHLPRNTYVGDFDGSNADQVLLHIEEQVRAVFQRCNVTGPVFVAVGGKDHRHLKTTLPGS